jgi:hypothetical protein
MRASSIDLSVLLASMDKIPEPATAPDLGRRTARASRLAPARRCRKMLVDPAVFDLKELQVGDEVLVDFVVRSSANDPLRAAGIWVK